MTKPIAIAKTTGVGLSYQDLGRHGWTQYGVAPAGAMDKHAFSIANKLLDNHPNDLCLEMTLGCVSLHFLADTWISLSGAARCDQLPRWSARRVKAGDQVIIHPAKFGIWSYLAIPGGFSAPSQFGSASRHERSALGQAIFQNSEINWNAKSDPYPGIAARYMHSSEIRDYSTPPAIRVFPGPHEIPQAILDQLFSDTWSVSPQSDRTGFRLDGTTLDFKPSIRSLPVLPGTIQLPPSGQPIVTLNDGPTCGGYPILGIIHPEDLSYFVQHAPEASVHFTQCPNP
ncbi:biotin-dependent carboxylase uncharacterized domain-containing protein [Rubritalea squalenifaciens DSM 18772]|uniref:Biotin-dependent carboxylase uncharacterized domain-containing protein n=2 Tax=Rubritalea TaxID=361050 RepID=A0A1M6E0P7_9BACT|nr:biotin-dependent carboxyltransferase family protein [Rubritalea squalenifaciens]SHI79082.1 biotin-dependent carboxylase uncharacterized domain-containing protein [Rubritalea squalenifaciens DSM 18772]